MATAAPVADAPPAATRWRRRGKRSSNDGSALVARGEPLIWLTGGALLFVLAMIAGLLALIFWQGLQTFWPEPLVQLQLADGSKALGEISRGESYRLSNEQVNALPAALATTMRERIARGEPAMAHRRLVRIGNYELTNEHFRWVADFEIAPEGESRPEWGLIIERVAWGRFYGIPEAYVVRHPRPISGDEEQLARLLEFLEQNLPTLDESTQKEIAAPLEQGRERLLELRRQSARSLAAQLRESRSSAALLSAAYEQGETAPLDSFPADAVMSEVREEWTDPASLWSQFLSGHPEVEARFRRQTRLQKHDIGHANREEDEARLRVRAAEIATGLSLFPHTEEQKGLTDQVRALHTQQEEARQFARQAERRFAGTPLPAAATAIAKRIEEETAAAGKEPEERLKALDATAAKMPAEARDALAGYLAARDQAALNTERLQAESQELQKQNDAHLLRMKTSSGDSVDLKLADIVRAYPANQLTTGGKLGVYFSRWAEFLADDPREANSEGGVFPAIWGTIAMTVIMSLAVVPFGVLAALYLREYARAGIVVSIVRISVNNLAGVPSIVFGVFGFGVFLAIFGAYLDGGPSNASLTPWPPARWFFALSALAVIAVTAFFAGLFSLTSRRAEASWWKVWLRRFSLLLWIAASVLIVVLIAKTPFFHGFYESKLPNPTYGKGGLLWASLTLALMTLPVVIVATEEALAAVPNSMREGSYACGASKWQTIARIVLPRALPGIMTGMILAMARGAGEVAPLMLVGAVKLAPELPVDLEAPFVHPDRSFMHLGFHIYDLAFQSQNSEAAKPMVFTTTLLLITIVAALNLTAIWLRARLRQRYRATQF